MAKEVKFIVEVGFPSKGKSRPFVKYSANIYKVRNQGYYFRFFERGKRTSRGYGSFTTIELPGPNRNGMYGPYEEVYVACLEALDLMIFHENNKRGAG